MTPLDRSPTPKTITRGRVILDAARLRLASIIALDHVAEPAAAARAIDVLIENLSLARNAFSVAEPAPKGGK